MLKIKKHDWILNAILVIFFFISILTIYSATFDTSFFGAHQKMIYFYLFSFLIMLSISSLDYEVINKISIGVYLFGICLLVGVFLWGMNLNKAKGWIELPGGITFQPAEIFKLILITAISSYLARKNRMALTFKDTLIISGITFVPFLLVVIQPDLGNAMAYIVILFVMLWIGGMKYTHFALLVILCSLLIAGFIYFYNSYHDMIYNLFVEYDKKHWADRLDTFLLPDQASRDANYHVNNAYMAIASGGFLGEGFLNGTSVKSGFVPYVYSDSIFVVIAEEFGFVGVSLLLLIYLLFIQRLVNISRFSRDSFGGFMSTGIAAMFLFQIVENIAMHVKLMPLTGITLPFISYGGTSLLTNMIAIGIVQSIYSHRDLQSE